MLSVADFGKYVGALLYIAITTHPEIQHAVMMLTKKLQQPEQSDLVKVKRVFRYLQGVKNSGLFYFKSATDDGPTISAYSDSDWAGDEKSRRSTSGNAIMMSNCVVSWLAKQQPIVAQSSTEAEYIAANEAAREVVWLRSLLDEIGYNQSIPTDLYVDNKVALQMINGDGQFNRRKHIAVKYFWIREQATNGSICVKWVDTTQQMADIFTKTLEQVKFNYFSQLITGTVSMPVSGFPRAAGNTSF